VTLPLIVARARDPDLAGLDLREVRTSADAASVADRIALTGALGVAKSHALDLVAEAKAELPALPERQRGALELVADGVVERYA
jgi:octaprenyl-diphosphate synthase